MKSWKISNRALTILQGDLTKADVDAVVNAANSRLAGGGGVDGAIHRAAGKELPEACREIISRRGHLPSGQAVITPGFNLPAKNIIHTVGPIWRGGDKDERTQLEDAYLNSMALARARKLSSIAFPAISCGAYGYPVEKAATIALRSLRKGLEMGLVNEAFMYLHDENAYSVWTELAENILE